MSGPQSRTFDRISYANSKSIAPQFLGSAGRRPSFHRRLRLGLSQQAAPCPWPCESPHPWPASSHVDDLIHQACPLVGDGCGAKTVTGTQGARPLRSARERMGIVAAYGQTVTYQGAAASAALPARP